MPKGKSNEIKEEGAETSADANRPNSQENVKQGNVRDEAEGGQESLSLVGAEIKPRKGMTVYFIRGREVSPALVLNVVKDQVIDLNYQSIHTPGRCVTMLKVEKGLKAGQWWPDLDESEAALKLEFSKCFAVS